MSDGTYPRVFEQHGFWLVEYSDRTCDSNMIWDQADAEAYALTMNADGTTIDGSPQPPHYQGTKPNDLESS